MLRDLSGEDTEEGLVRERCFLKPLLQEGADATCVEISSAFMYDGPKLTEMTVATQVQGA